MPNDNLFKRFWRQLCFDVPRMVTHKASRKRVGIVFLTITFVVLVFIAYWGPIAFFEYKFAGGVGAVAFLVIVYALAFSLRRGLKNSGNAITLGISAAPVPSLRQAIFEQRLILAAIINRGAFEAAQHSKGPLKIESGVVRASTIERLRAENLWETLPTPLRDRLASPEGSWTKEHAGKALLHLDAFAVLTWMLSPRFELASLRTASSKGVDMLRVALLKPDPIADFNFLRGETEIKAQQDPAVVYLTRLGNELVKRGVAEGEYEEDLEEYIEAYMAYASSIGEAEIMAEDLPIGGLLAGEAPISDILHLRGVSAVRLVTLQALQNALSTQGTLALQQVVLSLA